MISENILKSLEQSSCQKQQNEKNPTRQKYSSSYKDKSLQSSCVNERLKLLKLFDHELKFKFEHKTEQTTNKTKIIVSA